MATNGPPDPGNPLGGNALSNSSFTQPRNTGSKKSDQPSHKVDGKMTSGSSSGATI
jgi:hypothetical protein